MNLKIKIIFCLIFQISEFNLYAAANIKSEEEDIKSETTEFEYEAISKELKAWDLGVKLLPLVKLGTPKAIEAIKKLINEGADVNAGYNGSSALSWSKTLGFNEISKILINAGASENKPNPYLSLEYKLKDLAKSGDKKELLKLIEVVKKLNFKEMLVEILSPIIESNRKEEDIKELVQSLLDAKINVNLRQPITKQTALMKAAKRGYLDIIQLLIEAGADINAIDYDSERVLSFSKDVRTLKLLLALGVDFNYYYDALLQNRDKVEKESNFETVLDLLSKEQSRRELVIKKWIQYNAKKINELQPQLILPLTKIISEYSLGDLYKDIPIWFKLENSSLSSP